MRRHFRFCQVYVGRVSYVVSKKSIADVRGQQGQSSQGRPVFYHHTRAIRYDDR